MNKIKNILVPVDFSDASFEAVRYASFLAKRHGSKIFLLNIIPGMNYFFTYPDSGVISSQVMSAHKKMISEVKSMNIERLTSLEYTGILETLQVKSTVIAGTNIYGDIISYAENNSVDIIVMGTKGSTSLKKIFLGSKTERVIRLTQLPVLTISNKHKIKKLNKIVFASDFSRDSYSVYPALNNLVKIFNPSIHLLRINTKSKFRPFDELKTDMNKFAKRFSGNFIPHIRANFEIDEGIAIFAKLIKADLIAIGVHRKKGAKRILGNRTAEGLIRLTNIPVLAIDIP